MSTSKSTKTRNKSKGKRSKAKSSKRDGELDGERNGFESARVFPVKLTDSLRMQYEKEAADTISRFLRSGMSSEMLSDRNSEQRKAIHHMARNFSLATRSFGQDPNRILIISLKSKKFLRTMFPLTETIEPNPEVLSMVTEFVVTNRITTMEREHFLAERENKAYQSKNGSSRMKAAVPPASSCSGKMKQTKDKLPTTGHRANILQAIDNSNIVIISGGTGCGKTTQVPQFILEEAHLKQEKVRILVTQPRRIAAISISERVAKERGESLGDVVGYQVRLESKQSDKTLLTYCTSGVLLRMLTADPIASGITHIIMDEIHEREINTDYLLIALRECLKKRRDLKVILMSATIEGNMALFAEYFEKYKVEVIRIEARSFDVKIFHLEQILAMSAYEPPINNAFLAPIDFDADDWEEELKAIREEEEGPPVNVLPPEATPSMMTLNGHVSLACGDNGNAMMCNPNQSYYPQDGMFYGANNNTVLNASGEWMSGDYMTSDGDLIPGQQMNQFFSLVGTPETRPMVIDFRPESPLSLYLDGVQYTRNPNQHPDILIKQQIDRGSMPDCHLRIECIRPVKPGSVPPLIINKPVAAIAAASQLPMTPTSPYSPNSPSSPMSGLGRLGPSDGGFGFGEKHTFSMKLERKFREEMKSAIPERPIYYHPIVDPKVAETDFAKLRFAEKYDLFYGSEYEHSIDHNLVNHVVKYLADSPVFGTILVFLPGYDDIQEMTNRIALWQNEVAGDRKVLVIPLHSQMHHIDHGQIFKPVNTSTRKIILSTNIAEASITIEDVIFVVDTGKAKEKAYNHEAKLSSLTVCPIAKSNAQQRAGRAGRVANGYCIRLYSEKQYENMPETQLAEMKRSAIYDVTLHAKLFAPNQMRIADFLALAPEPPSILSIEQSMAFLEQIGALYSPWKFTSAEEDEFDDDFREDNVVEFDNEKDPDLTDMGRLMSRLPLDPQLSRMLLFGLALKCLTPIINLVAMLANRDPFILPGSESRESQSRMKNEVAQKSFSDHLLLIRLCQQYASVGSNRSHKFCEDHFLSASVMRMVMGTRRQLIQELLRAKLIYLAPDRDLTTVLIDSAFNKNSSSWPMVQAAIAAGCYPSIGTTGAEQKLKKVSTFNDRPASLHPSSVLKKQVMKLGKNFKADDPRLEYVVFQELSQMPIDKSLSMKMVTAIPSITALLFTGPIRLNERIVQEYQLVCDNGEDAPLPGPPSEFADNVAIFELDSWYGVRADKEILRQLLRLRHKFMHFFLKGIHDPTMFGCETPDVEKQLLDVIRKLLETEHQRYNFAFSEMPNFYIKDFPPYHQKNKKQANNQTSRQMNELQKANTFKVKEVGESIRSNSVCSSSVTSVAPMQKQDHQQNNVKQQQQSWNPHRAAHEVLYNSPLPTYDFNIPPPLLPSRLAYPNGPYQNNQMNWNAPPPFPVPPNQMQNGWPQHMQQQPANFPGPSQQILNFAGPSQQQQPANFPGPSQQILNFAGPSQQQQQPMGPQMRNMGGFSVRGRGGQKFNAPRGHHYGNGRNLNNK